LSRGSDPASYPAKPLGSYHAYRQLHGWILPPLEIFALGARGYPATRRLAGRRDPSTVAAWVSRVEEGRLTGT